MDTDQNPQEPQEQEAAQAFQPLREGHDRADQVGATIIEWLDEQELGQRIPLGMITLAGGRPGQAKSIWSGDIAARISRLGHGVIFSNLEDPLGPVVRPRLEAAGADLSKIHFWNPTIPKDIDALRTMVMALDVKLIVIDPVAAHLTVSIYNDQDVRTALTPLSRLAEETGCAILMITHTLKSVRKGAHPLEAFGGSSGGLCGAARVAYVWGPDPDEPTIRALACAKMNIAAPPKSLVYEIDEAEWIIGEGADAQVLRTGKLSLLNTEGDHDPVGLAIASGAATDKDLSPEKKAIAQEYIEQYLSGGARPVNEIREDAAEQGISWSTMKRASAEITGLTKTRRDKNGTKGAFGPGSSMWWELPPGHKALVAQAIIDQAVDASIEAADVDLSKLCCPQPNHDERFNAQGETEIFCKNCDTIIGTQPELPLDETTDDDREEV